MPATKVYWVSCSAFTCSVDVVGGTIVKAASVLRVFEGQPFSNLEKWLRKKFPTVEILPLVVSKAGGQELVLER